MQNLSFKLRNFSDDILSKMKANQMWSLLIDARDTLSSATAIPSTFAQPSNLLSTPRTLFLLTLSSSLTPKIDRVPSIVFSRVL